MTSSPRNNNARTVVVVEDGGEVDAGIGAVEHVVTNVVTTKEAVEFGDGPVETVGGTLAGQLVIAHLHGCIVFQQVQRHHST
ncbi:unnamed protein product [Hydatigera taeniaeformis]|uniref:Uncharacterized protein n=1 Tax=Hydatigena taeniaeformis TaxID=6205 RepID=A0A0R3WV93_HYDTA|nr:unnamed protein product [Hydatigera taeniaeformis]